MGTEDDRAGRLLDAQVNPGPLFDEVAARGIVAAGRGEHGARDQIRDLANEMFGTTKHWHKRIVRSGPHTLQPYKENPPDRVIGADDIVFADFGPIFEEFEADLGRTYVLGDDPVKHSLAADLPVIFDAGRRYFASHAGITGAQLYAEIARLAGEAGWSLGGRHAGHLVGEFPHEKIDGADIESYIAPGNTTPMRGRAKSGRLCQWILGIPPTDTARQFGAFYEQLLDLG